MTPARLAVPSVGCWERAKPFPAMEKCSSAPPPPLTDYAPLSLPLPAAKGEALPKAEHCAPTLAGPYTMHVKAPPYAEKAAPFNPYPWRQAKPPPQALFAVAAAEGQLWPKAPPNGFEAIGAAKSPPKAKAAAGAKTAPPPGVKVPPNLEEPLTTKVPPPEVLSASTLSGSSSSNTSADRAAGPRPPAAQPIKAPPQALANPWHKEPPQSPPPPTHPPPVAVLLLLLPTHPPPVAALPPPFKLPPPPPPPPPPSPPSPRE